MKRIFDEELHHLYEQFVIMGNTVKTAVNHSVQSFVTYDNNLSQSVIDGDVLVNKAEISIEKNGFKLIAQQQPVSSDLRKVVAIMKATSDLERVGDHAVSIAKSALLVKENERLVTVEKQLQEMAEIVEMMLGRVLEAYVHVDVQEAKEIAQLDEQVDAYLVNVQEAVVNGILNCPNTVQGGLMYILVAEYIERIGDYVTNICERIIYIASGEIVELN